MRAGIFQCAGGGVPVEGRLAKLADQLNSHDLDVVVCPELFTSGYHASEEIPKYAEAQNGPAMSALSHIAKSTRTALVFGYPEREGDLLFNSAAVSSPDGTLIANHRKIVLPPGFEGDLFTPGKRADVFDLLGFRCGILICYDAEFPETTRHLARAGAEVIFVPTALGEKWPSVARQLMPTRAFENGVWLLYANHAGEEGGERYLGESCIVAPDGNAAVRAGTNEELILARIDHEQVAAAQQRLPYLAELGALHLRLAT